MADITAPVVKPTDPTVQQNKQMFSGNQLLGIGGAGLALGGLGSLFGGGTEGLFGRPAQNQQFSPYNKQQQGLQNQSIQQALALLQGGQSPMFAPIANQARQQFNTQTIPGLAERFTAMGDSQRSSAFQGALGQAASNLETNLSALQSQHGLSLLQSLLSAGLQSPQENVSKNRSPGFLESSGEAILKALPYILAALA